MRRFTTRFKKFGPFSYFRVKSGKKNFLSAWLTAYESDSFGWEWGSDDTESNPAYCFRVRHFNVFSYESFGKKGYIIFVLGFWWMK